VISRCGLRRCRYLGLAKTNLQHVITAVAINLISIADWHIATPYNQNAQLTVCRSEAGSLTGSLNSPPESLLGLGQTLQTVEPQARSSSSIMHRMSGRDGDTSDMIPFLQSASIHPASCRTISQEA
jgi:hypothetical protein